MPKIMIVEDEALLAADMKRMLTQAGYTEIMTAGSPEEAFLVMESFIPDLAVVDIMLNGEADGIDFANVLIKTHDIPVIFLTAYSEPGVVQRAKNVSPYGYLLKPIRQRDLLIAIEMGVQRYTLEKKLKENERDLKQREEKFRRVFEASPIGIALYDSNWRLAHVNRAFLDVFGAESLDELEQYNFFKNITINVSDISRLNSGEPIRYEIPFDYSMQIDSFDDKRMIHIDFYITPLNKKDDGGYEWFLFQVQDITSRKKAEESLLELSILDPLTSSFNRRGFLSMARRQMDIGRRSGQDMILAFIDLDRMKFINDSFGHDAGDIALVGACDILRTTFRTSDLIGRWGGDEFVVLMINASAEDQNRLNERLKKNAESYAKKYKLKFEICMSAGIAKFNSKLDTNIETIIEQADRAMYEYKRSKHVLYKVC